MRWILLLVCGAFAAGCSSVQSFRALDSMSETEYASYLGRVEAQAAIIINAAVEQGDLSSEMAQSLSDALSGIAAGTTAGVGQALLSALDASGYSAAALAIAVIELDARLEQRGAYGEDGLLGERGRGVLQAIAARLASVE